MVHASSDGCRGGRSIAGIRSTHSHEAGLVSPLTTVSRCHHFSWSTPASFFRTELSIPSAAVAAPRSSADEQITGLTRCVAPPDVAIGDAARRHICRLIGPLGFRRVLCQTILYPSTIIAYQHDCSSPQPLRRTREFRLFRKTHPVTE